MFDRVLKARLQKKMERGKAIVVTGARQVGKTTLVKQVLQTQDHLFLNGDDPLTRQKLTEPNTEQIRSIIGKHKTVYLDEAQRIPNIGLTLKIITDQFPQVQLLVTGSSSFDLGSQINEPLTGRKWEYQLYPIAWEELEDQVGYLKAEQQLENRLKYGMYPDVLNHPGEEEEILRQLVSSYLYKDILALGPIRKPEVLEKLLQALAFQVGNEVSYNELAKLLSIDKNTVASYLDLLQKAYIIFSLGSFSRNLRNEIKKSRKIYFYDVGVRNMVIGQFNDWDVRSDKGGLWENFLIAERLKFVAYHAPLTRMYFWRTVRQQEIDLVEEKSGQLTAFEFKWKEPAKYKLPKAFQENYQADNKVIHRDNFHDFVMGQ